MIDTKAVSAFFDRLAPDWDANTVRDDRVIETILNHAGVSAGMDVLDIKTPRLIQFNYSSADFAA